jgi:hypothetical protein
MVAMKGGAFYRLDTGCVALSVTRKRPRLGALAPQRGFGLGLADDVGCVAARRLLFRRGRGEGKKLHYLGSLRELTQGTLPHARTAKSPQARCPS